MSKVFFAFICIVIFSICSCKHKDSDFHRVFRYNESKGITSLDPAFARHLALIWPVHQLYNGLVQLSDSLTVEPCIAHSWSIGQGGLLYTFNLRNDVFFHSSVAFTNGIGRKVTAHDFVYSFGRIMDPAVASPGAWIFSVLNTSLPNSINGCLAVNDSTLQVHLKQPFPAFLGLLSMPYAYVVPREAVEYFGKNFRSNPVGTGPFQLKLWREGEKLVFRRNPNYFEFDVQGKQLPYLEAINISFITDKQSELMEFILGNIDFMSGVYAASKDEMLTRGGNLNPRYADKVQMITGPYLNTEYIGVLLDTSFQIAKNNPLLVPQVRKAIAYGFDRGRLISYLRSNMGYPAYNGFVPMGMPGFSEKLKGFEYNPELSRRLLSEAGFPGGKGIEPIALATTEDYVDIFEFIQHQLADIGIPIRIEVLPGAAYREMLAHSRLLLFRGSWIADYADPENYLSLFHSENFSPSGPNYTHFKSRVFDSLYRSALLEPEDSKRMILYNRMDSIVISQVPVIPMYYDKVVRFVRKDVVGMTVNPMNQLSLKKIKKISKYDTHSR